MLETAHIGHITRLTRGQVPRVKALDLTFNHSIRRQTYALCPGPRVYCNSLWYINTSYFQGVVYYSYNYIWLSNSSSTCYWLITANVRVICERFMIFVITVLNSLLNSFSIPQYFVSTTVFYSFKWTFCNTLFCCSCTLGRLYILYIICYCW